MVYKDEKRMYPDIMKWLKGFLESKYRKYKISVFNTHAQTLSNILIGKNLHNFFPDYPTYDIKVDVTGILIRKDSADLIFVECKLNPITLKDVSQLLGYSKVAKPLHSIILSPADVSRSVSYLFRTLRRYDVLEYERDKKIIIAKWSERTKEILPSSIIPRGEFSFI